MQIIADVFFIALYLESAKWAYVCWESWGELKKIDGGSVQTTLLWNVANGMC